MKLKSKNILCSTSSGYSSVMMAVKMKEWYPDHNIVCAMANTSKERPESLEFMQKAADYFVNHWHFGLFDCSTALVYRLAGQFGDQCCADRPVRKYRRRNYRQCLAG